MAKKFTDKEYAEYMLANFVLGYIDTAIFIGANLFEKYFQKEVDLKKTERFIEFKVYKSKYFSNEKYWKQDVLHCYKKMEKHEIETEIEKFTHLRNDFVHGLDDNEIINRKNEIRKFILYIYFSFHSACRQVINEFGEDIDLIFEWDGEVIVDSLKSILPYNFVLEK